MAFITDRIKPNLLIAVTLCYITGAILAWYWPLGANLIKPLTFSLIISYGVLLFFHRNAIVLVMLAPLFILTGLLHTSSSLLPPNDEDHLYNLFTNREKVTLTGRILSMPEFDGLKTRFNLAADSILFHQERPEGAEQKSAKGTIRLSLEGALATQVKPGDKVMVLATANRIYNYRTPGVFDYRLYLADKKIYVSGKIRSPQEIIPFEDIGSSWHDGLRFLPEHWRYRIATFLQTELDQETSGIYQALLIGSRAGISDSILEQFKATGCMHLLAISGIHMSLLGLMITLSFTWIMKRSSWLLLHTHVPTVATLLALLPLVLYAFIAGLNTPVLRSMIMSCFFLIGIVLQRQRSIIFIIAAAALLLLIWKPLSLFTVSFQLSFSSIVAIAIIYPQLMEKIEQNNLGPGKKLTTYITSALLVSIAATLGTLPFMLYHFNRFSLIGPVMNLLVEPFLCLWALPLGLLAIPFIFFAPGFATLLLKCGSLGILAADKLTLAGSSLSFASFWTITPAPLEFILYYVFLFLLLHSTGSQRNKIGYGICLIALALFFIKGLLFPPISPSTKVSILDVGQGNSTLIELSSGRTILIDGGSKTSPSFNIGERVIGPFLRKERFWHLDDVIITHPHSDHSNGIEFILRYFRPERLWINGDEKQQWPYKNTLQLASKLGITIIEPQTGHSIAMDQRTQLTFLNGANPNPTGLSINDRSLVIRLDHGDNAFLFPGDISKNMERILLKRGVKLNADILLAPHHGSGGSGSSEFINEVNPEAIIISAGQSSSKIYPDPKHLTKWRKEGRTILTTPEHGTITYFSDGSKLELKSFTGK